MSFFIDSGGYRKKQKKVHQHRLTEQWISHYASRQTNL